MRKSSESSNEENQISVEIGRTGGKVEKYLLTEDSTVQAALEKAGITVKDGERIRVNGETAEQEDVLDDGDIVTLSGKVKGGKV